ncbi:MAG TPA: tripartite tricarboxylate transporter substrate binding protein [Burkholderiales bacterium]
MRALLLLACLCVPLAAAAQPAYPERPVKIIVPYSPGTSIDIIARTVGQKLSARWGQPVVVENRTGASGVVGTALAARASGDGYTLLMQVSGHVINPHVYGEAANYDPFRDFVPVSLIGWTRMLLVVNADTGIKTLDQLVREAKARPGAITYGTPGVGTVHHLAMEFFQGLAKIELLHVPHSNTGAAVTSLLSNTVNAMFVPIPVARPQLRNPRLTVLGVGSAQRSSSVPEIPTLAEQGLPGAEVDIWYAMLAPAGLPDALQARLNGTVAEILGEPETRAGLEKQGLEVQPSTPAELLRLMERESAKWREVVKRAGIKASGTK